MTVSQTAAWYVYLLLILSGAAGAVADWSLNQWLETRVWGWWAIVALGIGADLALFLTMLSTAYFPFGVAVAMSLVTHCLVGIGFDHIFYKTTYGPVVWAGIFFGLTAMVLMDLGNRGDEAETEQVKLSQPEEKREAFKRAS